MKIAMMFVGLLIEGDDNLTADILMNYAMNSLNLKQDTGTLRHIEVRELRVPSIVDQKSLPDEAKSNFDFGAIN